MKHEDFTSIDVEKVMSTFLEACLAKSGASVVHWLSAPALLRLHQSSREEWEWTFATADVVGRHVISCPSADLSQLFHIWKNIAQEFVNRATVAGAVEIAQARDAKDGLVAQPLIFNGALLGILAFEGIQSIDLKKEMELGAKYVAFAYQHLEVRNMSYLDELTNLYNQRYLPRVLEHEIDRARREGTEFSLLFLDIDYFKSVNDGRGHLVGSRLLVELGNVLSRQIRSCDYAFRYGGDEFIVLLNGSNAQNAERVAERIRQAVELHSFEIEGQKLKLTISIGLAAYPQHAQSASELIQLADQAMYFGKRKSRNIVFVAS